jgi:DNA polymerase-4
VSDLGNADLVQSADLLDAGAEKRAKAERAMDTVRNRFGRDGLALGLTFSAKPPDGKGSG